MAFWDNLVGLAIIGVVITIVIGVLILWTIAIHWALTYFGIWNQPYDWQFALAIIIISSLLGGIGTRTRGR